MVKIYALFQTRTFTNHTLWHRTYLYRLYRGVIPPPRPLLCDITSLYKKRFLSQARSARLEGMKNLSFSPRALRSCLALRARYPAFRAWLNKHSSCKPWQDSSSMVFFLWRLLTSQMKNKEPTDWQPWDFRMEITSSTYLANNWRAKTGHSSFKKYISISVQRKLF